MNGTLLDIYILLISYYYYFFQQEVDRFDDLANILEEDGYKGVFKVLGNKYILLKLVRGIMGTHSRIDLQVSVSSSHIQVLVSVILVIEVISTIDDGCL